MRIQLALDFLSVDEALHLLDQVLPHVDWVEVGTPMIKRYGAEAIRSVKAHVGGHAVVADMKTMDAGRWEADLAFASGAQIMTVLGCASDATISEALRAARQAGGRIVVDMLGVPDVASRTRQVAALGADFVGVHAGMDERTDGGRACLAELGKVARSADIPLIVAGGIGPHNVLEIRAYRPYAVIVGSAITAAEDPVSVARAMREACSE